MYMGLTNGLLHIIHESVEYNTTDAKDKDYCNCQQQWQTSANTVAEDFQRLGRVLPSYWQETSITVGRGKD